MTYHIAADIGGTKTLIQLVHKSQQARKTLKHSYYKSGDFETFEDLLRDFIDFDENIDSACFAIAGPIKSKANNAVADVTNLPWVINQQDIQQNFSINHCKLINDFQAIGHAIQGLTNQDLITLQAGTPSPSGTRAVIGAGTGLGQAILVRTGKSYEVIATEGGHVNFAPTTALEIELLKFLQSKFSHVSYEMILSGPGLLNIFDFLLHQNNLQNTEHKQIFNSSDPAAEIAKQANENPNSIYTDVMNLFTHIYGAQAGNFALNCLPSGGIYIAGGIAVKNQSLIKSPAFIEAFCAKGIMSSLASEIPVKLITHSEPGLIGATQIAINIATNTTVSAEHELN